MYRRDKTKNIKKANLMAEQRHLKSNSLIVDGGPEPNQIHENLVNQIKIDIAKGGDLSGKF